VDSIFHILDIKTCEKAIKKGIPDAMVLLTMYQRSLSHLQAANRESWMSKKKYLIRWIF